MGGNYRIYVQGVISEIVKISKIKKKGNECGKRWGYASGGKVHLDPGSLGTFLFTMMSCPCSLIYTLIFSIRLIFIICSWTEGRKATRCQDLLFLVGSVYVVCDSPQELLILWARCITCILVGAVSCYLILVLQYVPIVLAEIATELWSFEVQYYC